MENTVKCIEARLGQLAAIIDNVNECSQYLIKEIDLHLTNSYIDAEIIKRTFRGNQYDIEKAVRTQIKNLTFLDSYFQIVIEELTALKFIEIVNAILTSRGL